MTSSSERGNYYKKKTQEMYQKLGYVCQLTEFMTARPIGPGRVIYVKKDVFGSDGIAMNGKEVIFWNSKSTISGRMSQEKSSGKAEFAKFPFPSSVKRQLVIWEPRKQPVVIDCG